MLTIGMFSKISSVTAKTLRYYDEIGLIKPVHVNIENGYRFYDVTQLETILLINKLKSYFFSLEEIAEVLRNRYDDTVLFELLEQKKQDIDKKQNNLDYVMKTLNVDIENMKRGIDIMAHLNEIEVKLVETETRNVVSIRDKFGVADFDKYFAKVYGKVAELKVTPIGAPLTIYHDVEFNPNCSDMEIAIPVKEVVTGTKDMVGGLCAMSTHKGPYSELTTVYAKLVKWVEAEGYIIKGAYEIYQSDPATTAPEDYITEVYMNVQKR